VYPTFSREVDQIKTGEDGFDEALRILAQNLSVVQYIEETENSDDSSKLLSSIKKPILEKENEFFSKDLDELINSGFIVFKRSSLPVGQVKHFFDSISAKFKTFDLTLERQKKEIQEATERLEANDLWNERLM
jgi:hypothetical protein